jgi:hypothetical protein
VQVALSEPTTPPVSVVLKGEQLAPSKPPLPLFPPDLVGTADVCDTHRRRLTASERSHGQCYWCIQGPPPMTQTPGARVDGPRCGRVKPNGRECISMMYRDLGMGWRRWLGCGNRAAPLTAVAWR